MAGDTTDAAKDQLAGRFSDEEGGGTDNNGEGTGEVGDTSERFGPTNIKEEWTNHSVYLPDGLTERLNQEGKRGDYEVNGEYSEDLRKTRHYYPVIIELGLEQFEELDAKGIKEVLERIDD